MNRLIFKANEPYPTNDERSRNQTIDAFRGIAVLSVVAFHYMNIDVGRFGVHIFFVISGLVISMTMLKTGQAADFLVKRFARLFPALLACSLLTFLCVSDLGVTDFTANLTFFPKALGFEYIDPSYWTLPIEIEFYALVAASYFVLGGFFWAGVLLAACFGVFGKYMAFFLLGMGIYFWLFKRDKYAAFFTGGAGLIAYGLYGVNISLAENIYLVVCIAALAGILKFLPQFRFEPLAFIGRISYPLYLLHQTIGNALIATIKHAGWPGSMAVGAATALCLCLAVTLHYAVEKPAQAAILNLWAQRGIAKIPVVELP